jgi:hypothetical protein
MVSEQIIRGDEWPGPNGYPLANALILRIKMEVYPSESASFPIIKPTNAPTSARGTPMAPPIAAIPTPQASVASTS